MLPDLFARGEQVIVERAGDADVRDTLLDEMRAARRVRQNDLSLAVSLEVRQAIDHTGEWRLPVVQHAPEVEDVAVVSFGDLAQAGKNRNLGQGRPSTGQRGIGADRLGDTGKSVTGEKAGEVALDARNQAGPLVNESGIELHQAGAGPDLRISVGAARDAADADQRYPAAREPPHHADERRRRREQRLAAETARLAGISAPQLRGPPHGRVGDDESVDAGLECRLRDLRALVLGEIGRDLEEDRRRIDGHGPGTYGL